MFYTLVALQIISVFVIIIALVYMFRGGSTYTHVLMLAFLAAELVHNAGYILELFSRTEREAMMAIRVEYLGSAIVVVLFMMFVCNYCNLNANVLLERILLLCGCVSITLLWTNHIHHLFYTEVEFVETGLFPHLALTHGPGFYFFMITGTIIPWAVSEYAVIHTLRKEKNARRRGKLVFIICGTTTAIGMLGLYVLGVFPDGYDPTPLTLSILFPILVIFVWNRKDFDLTRTAANTVLNSLSDGMITLDENYMVLMHNVAAKQIFPDINVHMLVKDVEHFPSEIFEHNEIERFQLGDQHYEGHLQSLVDHENVIRGYTVFVVNVTKTYEHIQELNAMRKKAEEANRAKSNFLANMSHEIRTPMNAVVGMSEMIIEESHGRKIRDYAMDIKNASLNLLSIINDILDLSKVEAGKMELVEDKYYIHELLRDALNLVRMQAEQKGLQLKVKIEDDIPNQLYGDEGRIRQILINIINNAIKFTKEGYVSLDVSKRYLDEDNIELQFIIKDTGIGIKEEDLTAIFESFRQLDMNRNRKIEGTGLGLAITKQLVTLMQGDIHADSEYGKGTCFTIHIKQRVIDKRAIKEVSQQHQDTTKKMQMFTSKEYRVLVVDDIPINVKVATAMLRAYGFQIHEATSGMEAIELSRRNTYDMIFMDHMMPEMDGIEATKYIRSRCGDAAKKAVIVALTANALQGAKEEYLSNGFDDFLSKPFERIQLHELLEKWIPDEMKEYQNSVAP